MTHFAPAEYPTRHPGVERLENVVALMAQARKNFDGTRSLSAMLLAAMVAALVVVADQLVETWADGHLLAAWVVMWMVGFAALGLLARPTRGFAVRTVAALKAWAQASAQARADARLWSIAQKDARIMADLDAAKMRSERLSRVGW